jgi:hypothetical protein
MPSRWEDRNINLKVRDICSHVYKYHARYYLSGTSSCTSTDALSLLFADAASVDYHSKALLHQRSLTKG